MQNKFTHRIFEDKVDKLVHDKLVQQQIHSTTNEWNSLHERLHQKKATSHYKKLGILLLLISSISISAYILNSNTSNNIEKNSTANNSNDLKNNFFKNTFKNSTPIKESNLTTTNQGIISAKNVNLNNSENKNSSILNSKNEPIVSHNTFITKGNNQNKQVEETTKIEIANDKFTATEINKIEESKVSTKGAEEATIQETLNVESAKNSSNAINKKIQVNPNNNPIVNNIKEDIADKAIANVKKSKTKRVKRDAPEHSFDNERIWYIETFSGINNSTKNENSFAAFLAPAGYTNMRLQQENALSTMSAGVNFKVRKKHITISSGLNYLQMGDKINYDSFYNNNSFVKNANGKTNFTYVEIPIVAGYEWAKKRWGFTFQAGLTTGILSQLSGQYVSINNFNTQLFNVKDNKTTFRNTIFNLIVNPQVNYYFNEKSNLFIAPSYRRNLQAITNSGSDLKQKYNILGFNIGIRTKIK